MKAELLHMSHQEQSRLEVMRLYIDGHIRSLLQEKTMMSGKKSLAYAPLLS